MTSDATSFMILSWILYAIGLIGLLIRRNIFVLLLVLMLMFNASSLSWMAAARYHWDPNGHVGALLLLTALSAQFIVGLAIVSSSLRSRRSADIHETHKIEN